MTKKQEKVVKLVDENKDLEEEKVRHIINKISTILMKKPITKKKER